MSEDQRMEIDALEHENADLELKIERLTNELAEARRDCNRLQREFDLQLKCRQDTTKALKETSKQLAEARKPGPATKDLIETWRAKRAEHKWIGIPDEVIRVLPVVVDAVIAEWEGR